MKLNAKIIILISTSLVLTAASIGMVSTWPIQRSGTETTAQIERLGQDNIQRIKADGDRQAAAFGEELLALKKEYLKSQAQTALSLLEAVEKDAGLGPQEKQRRVADLVQALRYGPEGKDYFWINDLQPAMIMHPYKPELNGKDISDHKDPNGKNFLSNSPG